jgi:hypothetical protein
MPAEEILVLAVTIMRGGLCVAGFSSQSDPLTGLRWVRPVKEHSSLQLGDLTDASDRVIQSGDVVVLNLLKACSVPPHVEDWLVDWIYQRPRVVRRLEGDRRARLLSRYTDRQPADVLVHHTRSLCLIRPDDFWASFTWDRYSDKYEARLGFRLSGISHAVANSERGVPVTDLKWRALGRGWLGETGRELLLTKAQLLERLAAQDLFLALGLSRSFQGENWLLVVGVHAVPDYPVTVDYDAL